MIKDIFNMITENQNDLGIFTLMMFSIVLISIISTYIGSKYFDGVKGKALKRRMVLVSSISIGMFLLIIGIIVGYNLSFY